MDPYIKLAKMAVEKYLKEGKIITPPKRLPKKMTRKAGVFVSIHKKLPYPASPPKELKRKIRLPSPEIFDGLESSSPVEELRGCIGTYLPTQENTAQEIIKNALDSATRDPRFSPITKDELPDLIYSVDLLSRPKRVSKIEGLDAKRYGLIVSTSDGRRGLLLPDLPGVNTPEEQFRICCLKAGINPKEKVILQAFTVERHAEK